MIGSTIKTQISTTATHNINITTIVTNGIVILGSLRTRHTICIRGLTYIVTACRTNRVCIGISLINRKSVRCQSGSVVDIIAIEGNILIIIDGIQCRAGTVKNQATIMIGNQVLSAPVGGCCGNLGIPDFFLNFTDFIDSIQCNIRRGQILFPGQIQRCRFG